MTLGAGGSMANAVKGCTVAVTEKVSAVTSLTIKTYNKDSQNSGVLKSGPVYRLSDVKVPTISNSCITGKRDDSNDAFGAKGAREFFSNQKINIECNESVGIWDSAGNIILNSTVDHSKDLVKCAGAKGDSSSNGPTTRAK